MHYQVDARSRLLLESLVDVRKLCMPCNQQQSILLESQSLFKEACKARCLVDVNISRLLDTQAHENPSYPPLPASKDYSM